MQYIFTVKRSIKIPGAYFFLGPVEVGGRFISNYVSDRLHIKEIKILLMFLCSFVTHFHKVATNFYKQIVDEKI